MRVTRRFWTVVAVGVALAGWGIITAAPSLLLGAGGVGAWVVSVQYTFLRTVDETLPHLTVTLTPDEDRVTAKETTTVSLSATVTEPTPVSMQVTISTPVGVDGRIGPLRLDEAQDTQRSADLYWPVAGEFDFETPRITLCDRFGLFTQTVGLGESPSVMVEPRAPRNVHIGKGGDRAITGFGEHDTGETGSGLKPAEVREYVPGDAVKDIDWKATARLAEAHVREFDVQTDRETQLFLDHRKSMGEGPAGECKLDYARQLVLAVLNSARAEGDPIGCYTVGEGGLTATHDPSTTDVDINAIRREVLALTPTVTEEVETGAFSPADARHRARSLAGDTSVYAERLRPYFADQTQYVRRIESRPLFTALNLYLSSQRRTAWSVLLTDDTNRTELREAVKLARQLDAHVSVFVTPTVLFEDRVVTDMETAYDRYVEFEAFRHDIDSLHGVSAFELGPADRLSAILSAREPTRSEART